MKRIALIIAALGALTIAVACSPAETGTGTAPETGQPSPTPSATPDPLAFTQCMRDKGIDMDDPDPDSGRPKPGKDVDPKGEAYQAAMKDCQHLLPGSVSNESSDPENLKEYQAFATCMRENGMPDFPDPQPGGQGMFGNVDRTNPNFEKASKACQDILSGVDQ
ncbi:hypothetical protein [Flindersiella endophytica]